MNKSWKKFTAYIIVLLLVALNNKLGLNINSSILEKLVMYASLCFFLGQSASDIFKKKF